MSYRLVEEISRRKCRSFDCVWRFTRQLRSATVCFVKVFLGRVARLKRVMEKIENDRTVSHLSHNPGGYGGWSG